MKCNKCNKKVLPWYSNCPYCGAEIIKKQKNENLGGTQFNKTEVILVAGAVLVMVLILAIAIVFISDAAKTKYYNKSEEIKTEHKSSVTGGGNIDVVTPSPKPTPEPTPQPDKDAERRATAAPKKTQKPSTPKKTAKPTSTPAEPSPTPIITPVKPPEQTGIIIIDGVQIDIGETGRVDEGTIIEPEPVEEQPEE